MPRKARFYIPGVPAHIIQRGNDRQAVFYEDENYQQYKKWLHEGAELHGCKIHAYVLMTNHVHLLVSSKAKESIGTMMQYLGRRYVPYINKTYQRSGTLWEGRYKSCLIEAEPYLLACMRYIEENPVRAGMVKRPSEYVWSSYGFNALGLDDEFIKPHSIYNGLARNLDDCRKAYRSLFSQSVPDLQLDEIRNTVQTGTPLVTKPFQEKIEKVLGRKVGHKVRGRPKSLVSNE